MIKIDYKKELKTLYRASTKEVTLVEVPPLNFLMIDGQGDPNTAPAYAEAVEALYALAYNLKFAIKREVGLDYGVMPLQGLWWVEDMRQFSAEDKSNWLWTMMIMQPEVVTADRVNAVLAEVVKKKNPAALSRVRFDLYHEGLAVQVLHLGPYAAEAPTIARLHAFIEAQGYRRRGKHHEIYLGDPRKTAPEKLKTIIRQPIEL